MNLLLRKLFAILSIVLLCGMWLTTHNQIAAASSLSTYTLGIQSDAQTSYPAVKWLRLAYATCGNSNLSGLVLQETIRAYHLRGIQIFLDICQPKLNVILDQTYLKDAAAGGADAVQCGNEQMKYDPPATMYVPPDLYAQFYDLCQRSIYAVHANIPVLMGSLDPHVVGPDNGLLAQQVAYLNSMQTAMNTIVHPGGNWSWRANIIGLIDTWHNGYPSSSSNNLYQLFLYWAQQFQVPITTGGLSKHLWVVEGTGCFVGCGLNGTYQVSVSHILTLITDVLTTLNYGVSFFFFSGKDFILYGYLWPIGVLDINGNPKPLRQDLPMGARTLMMSCSSRSVTASQQEQLLSLLYNGCQLPSNYVSVLES
jgi:hypothetical protein